MKRFLLNSFIVLGGALLLVAIFLGGWILLNKLIGPYIPSGTRTLYQENVRAAIMAQPVAYVGAERCGQCHLSQEQEWVHSAHKTAACEDCHGPGRAHVEKGVPMTVYTSADLCLTCHAWLAARPDTFPQVHPQDHSRGLLCVQCHNPMHPEIGPPPQIPHAPPAGMDCLTCHGSQGLRPVPASHKQRSGESCSLCHREGGQQ